VRRQVVLATDGYTDDLWVDQDTISHPQFDRRD